MERMKNDRSNICSNASYGSRDDFLVALFFGILAWSAGDERK